MKKVDAKIELANTLIRKAGLIRAVQHQFRISRPDIVLELSEVLIAIEKAYDAKEFGS